MIIECTLNRFTLSFSIDDAEALKNMSGILLKAFGLNTLSKGKSDSIYEKELVLAMKLYNELDRLIPVAHILNK